MEFNDKKSLLCELLSRTENNLIKNIIKGINCLYSWDKVYNYSFNDASILYKYVYDNDDLELYLEYLIYVLENEVCVKTLKYSEKDYPTKEEITYKTDDSAIAQFIDYNASLFEENTSDSYSKILKK